MQLKPGTKLQGGKYEILSTLGQGGFGITYEAVHVSLARKVAIKEFFMKDCCERDNESSIVTVPTSSNRELVSKFKGKFLREARTIAAYDHTHIIRVIDVFEENGTAYYVMDKLPGGSLANKVKKEGPLFEAQAEKYIRQVADALAYIHERNTVHLDVKPSNILLNGKGEAVLIDFGISKHYDKAGEQTSSTPVGISKGYAPLEQGRDGDVSQFGPSTDIYALGATLYHLVSGQVPPEASIVVEEGLDRPQGVSDRIWNVIDNSMQPKRKDRPQSIAEFLMLFDVAPVQEKEDADETVVITKKAPTVSPSNKPIDNEKKTAKTWFWIVLGVIAVAAIILAIAYGKKRPAEDVPPAPVKDTVETVATPEPAKQPEIAVIPVTGIKLSKMTLLLDEGQNATLNVTITPNNATDKSVTWKSYDEQIVTVNKAGKVTAQKAGTATIIARCGEQETSCKVTVIEKPATDIKINVTDIKLSKTTLELEEGQSTMLKATVTPTDATDKTVTWKSYDEQIATVSKAGEITAKKAGPATIVARCGECEASCKVIVKEKQKPVQQQPVQQSAQQTQLSSSSKTGYENGHEWVDLGLPSGTKWATCNVGASSPRDYGNYYAWGETSTKSTYSWGNLLFRTSGDRYNNVCFSKYNTDSARGTVDNKMQLDPSDDAARANWGGNWRTPTKAQWDELKAMCTWSWTGSGYKVTGPNGQSITLPAAGLWEGDSSNDVGSVGYYWSSTLYTDSTIRAWVMIFGFGSGFHHMHYHNRSWGESIRPVTE